MSLDRGHKRRQIRWDKGPLSDPLTNRAHQMGQETEVCRSRNPRAAASRHPTVMGRNRTIPGDRSERPAEVRITPEMIAF